MEAGLKVFEFIPKWNVLACTSLIAGNVNKGALSRDKDAGNWVHSCVCQLGCDPFESNLNFNVILATAIMDMGTSIGTSIHAYILKTNNGADTFIGTALVGMYSKIGNAISAQEIFSKLEKKDEMACARH
uniref:Pentatricopeptide repeat-containing protein n=1 Tax=Quercus lobata TaxID=97700 RepID=A0A7N2L497_QUELO